MTMQQRLEAFHKRIAQLSIGEKKVKHYFHQRMNAPYVIWAEDRAGSYYDADNRKGEYSVHCTLDYFTKTEYDPVFDEIEQTLNELCGSGWRWNSTQYEDGTGLIHHEWEFWV